MQVSPATQPRLFFKLAQHHKNLRKQKQQKRIEEQKQYMQLLRQRNEKREQEKRKRTSTNRKKDGDFGMFVRNSFALSLTCKLFIGGYLVFAIAFVLFFLTPGHDKQLLGHQFYQTSSPLSITNQIMMANDAIIQAGDIIVVKRIEFIDLSKQDNVIYESLDMQNHYQMGRIQSIDVANFRVTILHNNTQILIPKERIKGKIDDILPDYAKHYSPIITMLWIANGMLAILLMIQFGFYWQARQRENTLPNPRSRRKY